MLSTTQKYHVYEDRVVIPIRSNEVLKDAICSEIDGRGSKFVTGINHPFGEK